MLEQDLDKTSINTRNDSEEYDPEVRSINPPIKTAPIVIKMQPRGKSPSPQPIVSTRPADMTFEDEKITDSDQIISKFVI
jgi:hypothetical protein